MQVDGSAERWQSRFDYALFASGLRGVFFMDNQSCRDLRELAAIEIWNQEFGQDERDSVSYIAREGRRWELYTKLTAKTLRLERELPRLGRHSAQTS
jgi:hypothetical protein